MRRALEEKRHFDWNHQSVPLAVCQFKIPQEQNSAWNAFVLCAALTFEKNGARVASANQLAVCWFHKVLVFRREPAAAHLAALYRSPLAGKLPENRERAFLQRRKCGRHVSPRSAELAQRI